VGTAIRVENLGKRYRIGQRERYLTLRDTLAELPRTAARAFSLRRSPTGNPSPKHIWALRDVSFEVREGEIVGIIGRNGAGKTTLLKVLARITPPTEGCAEVYGTVGSLLEVGTGFHPELSGRENVYLSGAILGMSKKDIDRRFDEIVAFAGVERFLDTALKHFSAGMWMRLAFAVAAHLEPDTLFVDEVLAVGDLEFQKKCLGKMSEVAHGGRTILFVSHQMTQIRRLCDRVLWIDAGRLVRDGQTVGVIHDYEQATLSPPAAESAGQPRGPVRFLGWTIHSEVPGCPAPNVLSTFGPTRFCFSVEIYEEIHKATVGIALRNPEGQVVWAPMQFNVHVQPGPAQFEIAVPYFPLPPGSYYWQFSFHDGHQWYGEEQCYPELSVETPALMHPYDHVKGHLNLPYEFKVEAR